MRTLKKEAAPGGGLAPPPSSAKLVPPLQTTAGSIKKLLKAKIIRIKTLTY
jgi:hypothetical protein